MLKDDGKKSSAETSYLMVWVIILAICVLLPLTRNNYFLHITIQMLFFGYLGQSWNIMCGYTGQASFGHAAFFGVGAYTSTLLLINLGLSPWIGMFVGAFLAMLLGVGVGAISFKFGAKGVYFAFISMGVAEIMKGIALLWRGLTNGAEGLLLPFGEQNIFMYNISMENKYIFYYIILVMLTIATYISFRIKKMRLGYFVDALKQSEDAAEMLGVNVYRYKLLMVAVSAFLTAFAGTFYAQYYQHFEPEDIFGVAVSFTFIFPVIIGGDSYLLGPILGSVVLTIFEEVSRAVMPEMMYGFHRILYGVIIIVVIVYLPDGLASIFTGKTEGAFRKFRRVKYRGAT